MWKSFIAILCAAGTVLAYYEPQSVLVHAQARNRTRNDRPNRIVRRFACPDGFVRLKRNCFYFSAGTANWQESHFFCKDRNATLATLPKKHINRRLREFLLGPQMKELERWIGARYNWGNMSWEWGVTGEKITYDGFSKLKSGGDQVYRWQCAAMNPERRYRWAARDCIESKHYVCRTPAARLGKARRTLPGEGRRKRIKSPRNKNGTLTRNTIDENEIVPFVRGRWRSTRRSRPMWGNGMKLGMRPPMSTRWAPGAKYSDRLHLEKGKGPREPDQWVSGPKPTTESSSENHPEKISKELSKESVGSPRTGPRTLAAGADKTSNQLGGQLGNMFDEEILFKN